MDAIRESGELDLGVVIGGVLHRAFTVRPATLADTYRGAEAVAIPPDLDKPENGPARVAYQMAVDDAQILCQLESLGDLSPAPSAQALAAELDPDDMALLRKAAASVKKKLRLSRWGLPHTDAPNTSSFAPASA